MRFGPPKRTSIDNDLSAAGNPTVLEPPRHRFAWRCDRPFRARLRHRRFWPAIQRHAPCDGGPHGARRDGSDAVADCRPGVAGAGRFHGHRSLRGGNSRPRAWHAFDPCPTSRGRNLRNRRIRGGFDHAEAQGPLPAACDARHRDRHHCRYRRRRTVDRGRLRVWPDSSACDRSVRTGERARICDRGLVDRRCGGRRILAAAAQPNRAGDRCAEDQCRDG
jgi:hypothetical protein